MLDARLCSLIVLDDVLHQHRALIPSATVAAPVNEAVHAAQVEMGIATVLAFVVRLEYALHVLGCTVSVGKWTPWNLQ